MKTNWLIAGSLALLTVASCKKESLTDTSSSTGTANIAYSITTNEKELSSKVDRSSLGVLEIKTPGLPSLAKVVFNPYPMTLIGSVNTPSANLISSDIDIEDILLDKLAYVAYRDQNKNYEGGIDFIDVSVPYSPALSARLTAPNTDIYALKKTTNKLFFAGATDISVNRTLATGAVFGYFNLNTSGMPIGGLNAFSINGDIAYDVDVRLNKAFIVTGPAQFSGHTDSWLVVFDLSSNTVDTSIAITGGVSVAVKGTELALLTNNALKTYALPSFTETSSTPQADATPYFTRKIEYTGQRLLVAAGRKGVQYYSETKSLLDSWSLPQYSPYETPTDLGCYSVSGDNSIVMAANGTAGLYVGNETITNKLNLLGYLDLNVSKVNAVKQKAGFAFAGTNDGLKIIQMASNVGSTGLCGYEMYQYANTNADIEVHKSTTAAFGGLAGFSTLHVGGIYKHCGTIAASKNFTDSTNATIEVKGDIIQGYTNSIFYFSVEPGATLKVDGDLTIFGDLMLEGNIVFEGTGHSLRVYGNVHQGGGSVTGSFTDVFNALAATPVGGYNTKILTNGTDKHPTTSQGVLVYQASANAGPSIEFNSIFPRSVSNMQTMYVFEGADTMFKVEYAPAYQGKAFRYTKKDNSTDIGYFGTTAVF